MKKLLFILAVLVVAFSVAYASGWHGCDAEPADSDLATTDSYTYIFDEASAITGTIDSLEYYVGTDGTGSLDFGVFTKSGTSFSEVDSAMALITTVSTLHQLGTSSDFTAMSINAGEYIGFFITSTGILEKSSTGGPGYWYFLGDAFDGGGANTFTVSGNTAHEIQIRVFITTASGDTKTIGNVTLGEVSL